MGFPHGQTLYRDRRKRIPDPNNPARTVGGDWDPDGVLTLTGAYLDVPSSTAPTSPTRSQALEDRALYLPSASVDVAKGDRIRIGGTVAEPGDHVWFIRIRPATGAAALHNPYTGWVPPLEVPLELTEG